MSCMRVIPIAITIAVAAIRKKPNVHVKNVCAVILIVLCGKYSVYTLPIQKRRVERRF